MNFSNFCIHNNIVVWHEIATLWCKEAKKCIIIADMLVFWMVLHRPTIKYAFGMIYHTIQNLYVLTYQANHLSRSDQAYVSAYRTPHTACPLRYYAGTSLSGGTGSTSTMIPCSYVFYMEFVGFAQNCSDILPENEHLFKEVLMHSAHTLIM